MSRRQSVAPGSLDRVVVIGTSCSGKTTFARKLAACHSTSHVELDAIHWMPHWQERPDEEFRSITRRAAAEERWVIEGNYSKVRDIVWSRATAVVWLNYPFLHVFWRALRRTFLRALRSEELFSGNRETFRQSFFSRGSILLWVLRTHWRRRREYRELIDQGPYGRLTVFEFRKPQEAEAFLRTLQEDR
jgi:adenylate kinase family enzyme